MLSDFKVTGVTAKFIFFFLSINDQLQEYRQSTANSFIWWQLTVLQVSPREERGAKELAFA